MRNQSMDSLKKDIVKRSRTVRSLKSSPTSLKNFMIELLSPVKNISDPDTIEWCKWLVAGGQTPETFAYEGMS